MAAIARLALGFAAVAAVVLTLIAAAPSGRTATRDDDERDRGSSHFATFEFAATPPAPAGTVCPGAGARCWNNAVEPQIRADADGVFYVASENTLLRGTVAAKSTDGGLHYASVASPNIESSTIEPAFAPGGGDVDVAVAPLRNDAGFYNVYVSSLTLANITVSTSTDGGASWSINPTSAQISGDDREWIAADGARKVCISYHDLATFNVNVDCSYDAGQTFDQHATAIDTAHAYLLLNNQIGNLAIDPASHVIYQPLVGIAGAAEVACGIAFTCRYHVVYMAVSTDGGRSFTDYPVYVGPSDDVGFNHQFPYVTLDRSGNVYVVFSDDRAVYYAVSSDRGRTWAAPVRVSRPPARTAIFPSAVAGDDGRLAVVYYGTSHLDETLPPDRYPSSAAWHVYLAQSLDATSDHARFKQTRVSPVVHYGGVCEGGVGCTGNRDLFDVFGVAASPTTGLLSIAYTDDQAVPQPGCTPEKSNTFACDHTMIAAQTAGPRLFAAGGGAKVARLAASEFVADSHKLSPGPELPHAP